MAAPKPTEPEKAQSISTDIREKPKKPKRILLQRTASEESCQLFLTKRAANISSYKIPLAARLSVRQKSALDGLRRRIPVPPEALPIPALPAWKEYSLNDKIPMLKAPKDCMIWSRGKLGKSIQHQGLAFNLTDPYNRTTNGSYNALHDPHAKGYLSQGGVMKHLQKQGLIGKNKEVFCSLKQFNDFRKVLGINYNAMLKDTLTTSDAMWKHSQDQLKRVRKYINDTEGKDQYDRKDRARAIKEEEAADRNRKFDATNRIAEARRDAWNSQKRDDKVRKMIDGIEKQQAQKKRLEKLKRQREKSRAQLLDQLLIKDLEVQDRIRTDKLMLKCAADQFAATWLQSKVLYSHERLARTKAIQAILTESRKRAALERQKKVDKIRKLMPQMIEKRKKEANRIHQLLKKFFDLWLFKVRARKLAPVDELHKSAFEKTKVSNLEGTLKYLRMQSGYEKLDDFIFNIMKMKQDMKRQIELEAKEEEEAAKKAAEEGKNGPTEDGTQGTAAQ